MLSNCKSQSEGGSNDQKAHAQSDSKDKKDSNNKMSARGEGGKQGPLGDRKRGEGKGMKGKKGKKGEIDLDDPKIPKRLRDAIKSGRIPPERAKQIMARFRNGGGPGGSAPNVKIEKVEQKGIHSFLILNGTVEPERQVAVYSRLSAYVKQIVKEEGDFVKKNDTLALLDDTEIRITYNQSKIQLEQAKLTLEDESKNHQRSQKLKETEMISEQDFQAAESTFNKAKLDYKTKQENFKDLELQLSYTKIKSAVEGYVTERMVEVGTRVNSNQQVYTVEDFDPLLVKVFVPTSDVVNLSKGMEAEISTDVLGNMIFNGNVKLINPRIDVQSGTVKVTIEVFDKSHRLKPGMFVETKVMVSNNPTAIVIPKKCVSYKQEQAFVWVFHRKDRQVSKRIVKPGISEGDNIEILEGLEAGERVVTVGVESLKDKMNVKVLR